MNTSWILLLGAVTNHTAFLVGNTNDGKAYTLLNTSWIKTASCYSQSAGRTMNENMSAVNSTIAAFKRPGKVTKVEMLSTHYTWVGWCLGCTSILSWGRLGRALQPSLDPGFQVM